MQSDNINEIINSLAEIIETIPTQSIYVVVRDLRSEQSSNKQEYVGCYKTIEAAQKRLEKPVPSRNVYLNIRSYSNHLAEKIDELSESDKYFLKWFAMPAPWYRRQDNIKYGDQIDYNMTWAQIINECLVKKIEVNDKTFDYILPDGTDVLSNINNRMKEDHKRMVSILESIRDINLLQYIDKYCSYADPSLSIIEEKI